MTGPFLVSMARGLIDAINARDFDSDHPDSIWHFVSAKFITGETYVGADGVGDFYGTGTFSIASRGKALTEANPDLQLNVTSSSSEVDQKHGIAVQCS